MVVWDSLTLRLSEHYLFSISSGQTFSHKAACSITDDAYLATHPLNWQAPSAKSLPCQSPITSHPWISIKSIQISTQQFRTKTTSLLTQSNYNGRNLNPDSPLVFFYLYENPSLTPKTNPKWKKLTPNPPESDPTAQLEYSDDCNSLRTWRLGWLFIIIESCRQRCIYLPIKWLNDLWEIAVHIPWL